VDDVALNVRESMLIVDGGPDSELPRGSGGPVLAGPEAIFVAGRVDVDADTSVRLTQLGTAWPGLIEAYRGTLETPDRVVRLVNVSGDVLAELAVPTERTSVVVFVSDLDEPDEVVVSVGGINDG
jgi:hypothetical protein